MLNEKPSFVQKSLVVLRSFIGRFTKIDFTFILFVVIKVVHNSQICESCLGINLSSGTRQKRGSGQKR